MQIIICLYFSLLQLKAEVMSSLKSNFGRRLKIVNVGKYIMYNESLCLTVFTCTGGAATSKEVLRFMRELFYHCFVIEGYGCTEIR